MPVKKEKIEIIGGVIDKLYWLVPVLLFILQAFYTFNSFTNIRVEDYTVSISTAFWLGKGSVCDVNNLVGWGGILLAVFKIFGFSILTPKFVRLFIHLIFLLVLSKLLKKYLGPKKAILPLLTIGLSPTLLYFNTLISPIGIDLAFYPILLFLINSLNFTNRISVFIKQILLGAIGMVAIMSYPTMLYYLPVLIFFYIHKLSAGKELNIRNLGIALVSFILPLALIFIQIQNRAELIYNPSTNSGLFRGNGKLTLDPAIFFDNLSIVSTDLFNYAQSYYFEPKQVEFSDIYPIITILLVAFFSFKMYGSKKKYRKMILVLSLTMIFGLIFSCLTGTSGGIRRSSVILGLFYTFFVFAWYFFTIQKNLKPSRKILIFCGFSLLLLHHILAYLPNYNQLPKKSPFQENVWFNRAKTPEIAYQNYLNQITTSDVNLICLNNLGQDIPCEARFGYNLIYSVIKGSCEWNHLNCHNFNYYNTAKKIYEPLVLSSCLKDP